MTQSRGSKLLASKEFCPGNVLVKQQEEVSQMEVCVCLGNASNLKAVQIINSSVKTKRKRIGFVTKQAINREHLLRTFFYRGVRVNSKNVSGSLVESYDAIGRRGCLREETWSHLGVQAEGREVGGGPRPCCQRAQECQGQLDNLEEKSLFLNMTLDTEHVVNLCALGISTFWIFPILLLIFDCGEFRRWNTVVYYEYSEDDQM